MFHIPLGYTSHSVSVHLPRSSTPIHALPTTCHWNIELIDWSDIPRLVRNDREYNNSHEKYANGKGRGSREKTKFLRSRFVARSVISPWKVQWKIAKERAGRGREGGGKGGEIDGGWCESRPRRTYKLWRERSRHQPLGRPGNLGRATRLSCFTKTIILSRQRYALSAVGRRDDDRRVRALWLANVKLISRARRSLELLSAVFYFFFFVPMRSS